MLHVADGDAFVRFGRMFRQLGLALSNEGVDVALLTDDAEAAAGLDGTPVIDYFIRSLRQTWRWRLESHLRRAFPRAPDIVHLWGTQGLAGLSAWTSGINAPLIVHLTSGDDVLAIRQRGLRAHEQPVVMCRAHADALVPHLAAGRAAAAGGGVDVEIVPPALLAPAAVADARPGERTIGLVWSGRIDVDAGLEVLIGAVALLRQRGVDLQLALIGEGPDTDRVWRRIADYGVADRVSLTGGLKIWDQVLPGADVCVVPARQQRLTLAPLLAMASGNLVIASDDQPADWFVADQTALLFPAGEPRALASQLQRFAERHPGAMAVRRAAREYVMQHHSVTQAARRLVRLYRELAHLQSGAGAVAPATADEL